MKSLTLTRGVALSAALLIFDPAAALAAGGEKTPLHLSGTGTHHASSSGTGGSIVRTLIGLLVVVVVIYGVSWIMRQFKSSRSKPIGEGLANVASLPLGNGRSVSLVRVGHELVLLGVSEHNVSRLRTYTEAEALEHGLIEDPALVLEGEPELLELTAGATTSAPRSIKGLLGTSSGVVDTLRAMTVRS